MSRFRSSAWEIEHDRKAEPAFRRPDVRGVSALLAIRHRSFEIPGEQVRGLRGSGNDPGDRFPELQPGVFIGRGLLEPSLLRGHETILPHRPGRAVAADPVAVVDEIPVHPRAAIGVVRQSEGRGDMRKIDHVLSLALAGRTVAPGENPLWLTPRR